MLCIHSSVRGPWAVATGATINKAVINVLVQSSWDSCFTEESISLGKDQRPFLFLRPQGSNRNLEGWPRLHQRSCPMLPQTVQKPLSLMAMKCNGSGSHDWTRRFIFN